MTEPTVPTVDRLACKVCNGSGLFHHDAFDYEGKHHDAFDSPCNACDATGWFSPPDVADILSRIVAKQGKNKGKLRASFTSPSMGRNPTQEDRANQVRAERAYFVWRNARFNGGVDPTMPMTASLFSRGDPYKDTLEMLASAVAIRSFGTDRAGAARWGKALLGSAYTGPDPLDLALAKLSG